jgi:hypothetical protein
MKFLSKPMDSLRTVDMRPKGTRCLARGKAPNLESPRQPVTVHIRQFPNLARRRALICRSSRTRSSVPSNALTSPHQLHRCTASSLLRDLSSPLWHQLRLAGGGSHSWRLLIHPSVVFSGLFSCSDAKVRAFSWFL